jgi:solute carrier family 45, member 1/2/4
MVAQPTNKRGLGTDIAVVGSMLFLAQIIISLSIGALVKAVGTTKVLLWVSFKEN